MFRQFLRVFLDEIHVRGDKIVYNHVWIVNVRENIPKEQPRVLEEGAILVAKTAKGSPPTDGNQRPVAW